MNLDQILPKVYVGFCPRYREDIDRLKKDFGITAVLNLQTEDDFAYWEIDWGRLSAHYQEAGIDIRRVPVRDFAPEDLRRNLPACVRELDELLRAGHIVYVHCTAGVNRSPSTVVAYLHWIEGRDFDEAVELVIGRRFCDPYSDAIRLATKDRSGE